MSGIKTAAIAVTALLLLGSILGAAVIFTNNGGDGEVATDADTGIDTGILTINDNSTLGTASSVDGTKILRLDSTGVSYNGIHVSFMLIVFFDMLCVAGGDDPSESLDANLDDLQKDGMTAEQFFAKVNNSRLNDSKMGISGSEMSQWFGDWLAEHPAFVKNLESRGVVIQQAATTSLKPVALTTAASDATSDAASIQIRIRGLDGVILVTTLEPVKDISSGAAYYIRTEDTSAATTAVFPAIVGVTSDATSDAASIQIRIRDTSIVDPFIFIDLKDASSAAMNLPMTGATSDAASDADGYSVTRICSITFVIPEDTSWDSFATKYSDVLKDASSMTFRSDNGVILVTVTFIDDTSSDAVNLPMTGATSDATSDADGYSWIRVREASLVLPYIVADDVDIKPFNSVDVLKDASSAAIYSDNGAILVTTLDLDKDTSSSAVYYIRTDDTSATTTAVNLPMTGATSDAASDADGYSVVRVREASLVLPFIVTDDADYDPILIDGLDVLKDASSAAIYSDNGVILVNVPFKDTSSDAATGKTTLPIMETAQTDMVNPPDVTAVYGSNGNRYVVIVVTTATQNDNSTYWKQPITDDTDGAQIAPLPVLMTAQADDGETGLDPSREVREYDVDWTGWNFDSPWPI